MSSKIKKEYKSKSIYIIVTLVLIALTALIAIICYFISHNNLQEGNVVNFIIENKLDDAKKETQMLIKNNGKNYKVYNYSAFINNELGQKNEAYKDIEKSIGIKDDKNYVAYAIKAYFQLIDNDIEGAKASAEKVKNIQCKNEFEHFILGSLYANTENKNKAIDCFNLAISTKKNYSRAYSSRGEVYLSLKENEKAIKDFETAISLSSENYHALSGKIKTLINMKKYDQAIELGEKSLKEGKINNMEVLYSLLVAFDEKKDYKRLLNLGNELIKHDKIFVGNLYQGWAYYSLLKYENAIDSFTKSIESNKNESFSYNMRAWCYHGLKKYNESKKDFKKAIELNERYFDAYRGLAWAHNNLNEYDQSIKICNNSLSLDKNNANIYACLGWNYLDKKDNKKAKEYFDMALSINKEDSDAKKGIELIK